MDLHVGIDIPSHQISKQNHRICFWGGESYATIKMEGFPHNIQQAYSRAGVRVVIALPFGILVDDTISS